MRNTDTLASPSSGYIQLYFLQRLPPEITNDLETYSLAGEKLLYPFVPLKKNPSFSNARVGQGHYSPNSLALPWCKEMLINLDFKKPILKDYFKSMFM